MPRPRSPNREKAKALWLESNKMKLLKDISKELGVSEEQVRKWKNQDKWEKVTLPIANSNVINNKGGQPKNKNAEKHGFFSKYLPEETLSIAKDMSKNPLDILWENIQIAYAAIIRSQTLMFVKDQNDMTKSKIEERNGESSYGEKWEFQYAWEKQAAFLKAQARAQGELRSLIKQYDEMLHKDWDLTTEEQRARIDSIKSKIKEGTGSTEDKVADMLRGLINDLNE